MLAELSTSNVRSGLPAGGGISRTHVGFNSTKRTIANETVIRPIAPAQRRSGMPGGFRSAYQISIASPIAAIASQSAPGMRGSKLRLVISASHLHGRSGSEHAQHAD